MTASEAMASDMPVPPVARKVPVSDTRHGITRVDDYGWLRDADWRAVMRDPQSLTPEIRAHLEAENAYMTAMLSDTEALQETLFKEMRGRIKEDDSSVPQPDGAYAYASRYGEGMQHPLLVRTPRAGGDETLLLDCNAEAEGEDYFRLGGASHSPDHALLSWSADRNGSEYFTLRIRDLGAGTDLEDTIPETSGGSVWAADSKTVFYTLLDENHRPSRVMRHVVGTPVADDVCVYSEPDPGFFVGVDKTQSGRFIIIDAHDHQTSEIHLIDAENPDSAPILVAARETEIEYSLDDNGDRLIILTNADGAEDFKLVAAPLAAPGRDNWRDLVPHKPGRLILSHGVLSDHMVRLEREDGLPRIVVTRFSDNAEHEIAFKEDAYALGLSLGYEYDTTTVRFTYSSMTTPSRVYDYDVETRQRTLRKEQEVPSGHDPADYRVHRLHATAPDGELVPVTVLHHAKTPLDGTAPCLLYGYGSYGIAMTAGFAVTPLSLVDRGAVYAMAHIRGGKDLGFRWYREGRREKKTNTFTDFIAVADHLAGEGLVDPARIVAQGGSAGGMLMGAIANMRPDRFAGIIAEVPFVDVLNTMLDDTLPLTPPEWPEWGNPIASEADYRTIAAYSPYDNVTAQAYPAILAVAGLTDPRVTYWEPAKWVAKLRELGTGDEPILLKTHMSAGHGGASGRFDSLKDVALAYAFALKVTGLADVTPFPRSENAA
ncbi:MAG: S9 family peptidase [Rhodobiaceae bacterium]|nr:S9 family peptidase [Rhodobiaceae bacterium]